MSLHLSLPPATKPLDNRRLLYFVALAWERGAAVVGLGPDRDGRVREIWVDGVDGAPKEGSDFLIEARAGCMMASWLLQGGMSAAELHAKLVGGASKTDTGVIVPSFAARALAEAMDLEQELGEEIRENYAHEAATRDTRRSLIARKTEVAT
jgi:hypothetical protein